MALPSGTYAPRNPAASVLYQVVRDHYHTFRAEASQLREGEGLPRFVDDEFDAFLRCGLLAGGFARFRCTGCRAERLVAFSCKGRGFCPSCGGRRMTERAAHLVDHVWPEVPVRQWVRCSPAAARPLRPGLAPRPVHRRGRRAVPRGTALPADVGSDAPARGRTKRGHHRGPAFWWGTQSQRPLACARARRRVRAHRATERDSSACVDMPCARR